jgi:hypothetical protein
MKPLSSHRRRGEGFPSRNHRVAGARPCCAESGPQSCRVDPDDAFRAVEATVEGEDAGALDPSSEGGKVGVGEVETRLIPKEERVTEEGLVRDLDPGKVEDAPEEAGRFRHSKLVHARQHVRELGDDNIGKPDPDTVIAGGSRTGARRR